MSSDEAKLALDAVRNSRTIKKLVQTRILLIYQYYNRSTIGNIDIKFNLVTLYLLTILKIILIVIVLHNNCYLILIWWNA